MRTKDEERPVRVGRWLAGGLVGLGVVVLVACGLEEAGLTSPVRGTDTDAMMPSSAVLFVLAGAALWIRAVPARGARWWIGQACAAVIVVMTAIMLIAYEPIRASPFGAARETALAFLLLGFALLVLDRRPVRRVVPAEVLAGLGALIGLLVTIGYLFGYTRLGPHLLSETISMASHTAVGLIALGTGILAARPHRGTMAVLTSPRVGGVLARRLLVIAAVTIPLVGALGVWVQRVGMVPFPGGVVLGTTLSLAILVAAVLFSARTIDRIDAARSLTEAQLRQWKQFFDLARFGAVFASPEGRLLRLNAAFARMHGHDVPGELIGRPLAELCSPEARLALPGELERLDRQGGHRFESEHLRKDGSVFPVVLDAHAVRNEAGVLLYRAAYIQDISDERRARTDQARLASLVASSADAITAIDLTGDILSWNLGAQNLYGYAADEIIGRPIQLLYPPGAAAEAAELFARVKDGEVLSGLETERVRKDGARVPVSLTLSPMIAQGKVIGFSAISRDNSATKALERLREEWTSVVAHDLRQPLNGMLLAADLLATSTLPPAEAGWAQRIRRGALRLDALIRDLLDASRLEAHRLELRPARVELGELVATAVEDVPELAPRCEVRIGEALEPVLADPARILQVLGNLLSNAGKYGDPTGPITVSVERTAEGAHVTVTNRGAGIPADILPLLFDRFTRSQAARRGAVEGTGLGLYICKGLVEAHGGRIWAESRPGDTTSFHVVLPFAPTDSAEAEPPAAAPAAPRAIYQAK